MFDLMNRVLGDVAGTFARVWPFLALSVLAAAALKVYVGTDRVTALLKRRRIAAVGGAVLLATLTPFCSCGTTAVLLGMLATSAPWAPLLAFMVASPLTSPSELVFSAGLLGWRFALVFFLGTIGLGLAAGAVADLLDRLGWLEGQARLVDSSSCESADCETLELVPIGVGPGTASIAEFPSRWFRWRIGEFVSELLRVGRKLLLLFLGFTAVGYLAIEAIPTEWLTENLGDGSALAVPLAALLGIPVYLNTEASLPLVAALMQGGMGAGPAMAFLVTGAGTSVGAISGLFVIARGRVIALAIALLTFGALTLGLVSQVLF